MKMLLIVSLIFFVACQVYSQDVINTLGDDGEFIINDESGTTFLNLKQSDGILNIINGIRLETMNGSQVGILYKGNYRFLHNYAPLGSVGHNTFLGIKAGNFDMSGTDNFSSYNVGIGDYSLHSNTTGLNNTAMGYFSLKENTEGRGNTAVGYNSLSRNTTGRKNTAVGLSSLCSNIEGLYNTAVGYGSLFTNTGSSNTAIGCHSLWSNIEGNNNTAVGNRSLFYTIGRGGNTALGNYSLYSNTIGYHNTAVGDSTLLLLTGVNSYNNTAIGFKAGITLTSGRNNTLIGNDAQTSSETASHEITLGNRNVRTLRCRAPSITTLSDARDKKNISDLSLGLNFITKLKPRQYNWDRRDWYEDNKSDGSKMEEKLTAGFIAQEFDEVQQSENAEWLDLVYKNNPEKLEATTGNLLPVMVKAIQELEEENNNLKEKNSKLEERVQKLEQLHNILVNEINKIESRNGRFGKIEEVDYK